MLNRRQFLISGIGASVWAASGASVRPIRQVDIIHHSHTDIGYTDTPSVVLDKQRRFLDAAIDLCIADRNFRWTVESLVVLDDWWKRTSGQRRGQLRQLVRDGQMDVMALPFNQTPFLDALQWNQMMAWIPASLWRELSPKVAMQNDVNGFPRAGAVALLDHGVRHLLMGLNVDSGGTPFYRPSAFWWRMPNGQRLFVFNGEHYGRAMTWLGAPRQGLKSDEASVRAAHARFRKEMDRLQSEGYPHERLIMTFTHPASYDNGWPFPTLAPFIQAWNSLELQPRLRLTTATAAALEFEKLVGDAIPELVGEWTDWWANGNASGPREVAASRFAKRRLSAALSPTFGPLPAEAHSAVEEVLRDLCLFDEHTWGASTSIRAPYGLGTLAQYTEKSELAYRPMAHAAWLLTRRIRSKVDAMPEGKYVINSASLPVSGWAGPAWVEKLPARSIQILEEAKVAAPTVPKIRLDDKGWPAAASWSGMPRPLFDGGLGSFLAVELKDRGVVNQIHRLTDLARREELRRTAVRMRAATYGTAKQTETPHTVKFAQDIQHPRIERARRTVEIWRREPRARVLVTFDRVSSPDPELFFIDFSLPRPAPLPVFSSGGMAFTPYTDQLKGSCRDHFGIDGWAQYKTGAGQWLWVTRDAPLVTVGGPHTLELHEAEPADTHRIAAIVFDNSWHTNFVADSHGTMEFQFEMAWAPEIGEPAALAEALTSDPIVFAPPTGQDPPALLNAFQRD